MDRKITFFFLTQILLSGYGVFARLNENLQMPNDETTGKLIVGGESTEPGRYPYQVGLLKNGSPDCGGSLIDSQWVLSAAHCAGFGSQVAIGRYDFSDDSETFETIEIAFEMKHPNYSSDTEANDLMLIRLKEPSTYATVRLDDGSADLSAGTDVTVMGWGATSEGGFSSDVLLEVEVDVVSVSDCNSVSAYNGDVIEDVMMCAAREGKDSCQGDSGGPLIIKGEDGTSDIQVGVVSFGIGCAQADYPGVYARVDAGLDFIESYQTCTFEDGTDDSSFEGCCNVICENGVFTCQDETTGFLSTIFEFLG